ncbi:hypothetical protein CTM84_08245 [Photobacterium kishitanii]|nr:hypothetical protein CTM84_08245 [Photobacterium kishitanii]
MYISTDLHHGMIYNTYLPIYLSTYLPIYLSTYLPIYLSTYLPIYLPIYLSTDLYTIFKYKWLLKSRNRSAIFINVLSLNVMLKRQM